MKSECRWRVLFTEVLIGLNGAQPAFREQKIGTIQRWWLKFGARHPAGCAKYPGWHPISIQRTSEMAACNTVG